MGKKGDALDFSEERLADGLPDANSYVSYAEEGVTGAFIALSGSRCGTEPLFRLRDRLAEGVAGAGDLRMTKREGVPCQEDSDIWLFDRGEQEWAESLANRPYPRSGCLASALERKEGRLWWKEQEGLFDLARFILTTSHADVYLHLRSRIHSEEDLVRLIKAAAEEMGIKLRKARKAPPSVRKRLRKGGTRGDGGHGRQRRRGRGSFLGSGGDGR